MYRVQLQDFEGPLDLLLFFIKRDELDIYDIPIARITDEYLSYVQLLKDIDLDGAGEFVYMAAVLIGIKARMLLPREELDETGEVVDPRQELVDRLLEYVRYKEASQHLDDRYQRRSDHFTRGLASRNGNAGDQEVTYRVSVFELMSALQRVLAQAPDEPLHAIQKYDYSVEEQQDYVLECLARERRVAFSELVSVRSKQFVIVTFLAILELARQGYLRFTTSADKTDFYVRGTEPQPVDGDHD